MAHVDPKLGDFGAHKKIYDLSSGMYTVRPREDIPENASPYLKNVVHDKHYALSKVWGSKELLTISSNLYNRFINTSNYVYGVYPFVTPDGQSKLIIQGLANSSHSLYSDSNMSLFALDVQGTYPASVNPTRILGAGAELANFRRCTFATYKGRLYVWNGSDYLMYWNGTDWRNYHTTEAERFRYITTYGRRLWAASSGANPSRVIYTNLNTCNFAHYFLSGTNSIDFNSPTDYSPIMWITQFKNSLLVFKQNSIYRFIGDPDTHGISFDIVSHGIGTISGWSVQVFNDRVYFAGRDGIYVYGDYNVIATPEDRFVQTEPNIIRVSSEIDDWWKDNFTLPDMEKSDEISRGGYEDFCSTLAFTAGGDATNFKADNVGIEANDYIRGATSNAVARVGKVGTLTSGTWTGGDAAGTLYLTEVYAYLAFDGGGTSELGSGRKITGATSAATAWVYKVRKTSGTWAGGDAAGYLLVQLVHGTFQNNENLNADSQSNIATVDGTLGEWTATEKIHIGSKEYATAGTFTPKFRLYNTRLNVAPVSENADVINCDIEWDSIPHTSEQSQTTQDSEQALRSTNGANQYYSQSFKLADDAVDYAICSGVSLWLKETGDVSGDTLKVYLCGETDSEPDFDKLYAEGSATGVFLHGIETLIFDSGSEEPKVGDTITENGGDGTGVVHKVVVTAGTWSAGTAEGIFYLKSTAGTWSNDATIDITGGNSNVATVNQATDAVPISTGCWVFIDMDYWDYPQNMYDGSLTSPPVVYVAVKVTGDNDANYLEWGYNSAGGYADGRMRNSDSQTPSGQADDDYCFNVYCRAFRSGASLVVETDTFDGSSSLQYWKSPHVTLNDDTLGDYTRNYRLEKIEYLTKAADSGWTDWSTASETTNGGSIGDGTNLASYRYLRLRLTFNRPHGTASDFMDSFTVQNIRASYTTEYIYDTLVDSAIHEDRYVFSFRDITDPEATPS